MDFWTLEEFTKFDNVIDNLEYRTFLISYTGDSRHGEVQAITRNDFTPCFKYIRITKTIQSIAFISYEIKYK